MIPVFVESPAEFEVARDLADRLQVPLLNFVEPENEKSTELVLKVASDGFALCYLGKRAPGPIRVDFISGAAAHRRIHGGGFGQMIAKACGVSSSYKPNIADLTAGLGRDAYVLASLGAHVTMVERVPLVYELLRDGLSRGLAQGTAEERQVLKRMKLLLGDSGNWLNQDSSDTEVVYLDPMFPHSGKSAQVKKEMRAFRELVGKDEDADRLLDSALESQPARVVVKRPRKAPWLANRKPNYALEGKSGRFDIYSFRKLGS